MLSKIQQSLEIIKDDHTSSVKDNDIKKTEDIDNDKLYLYEDIIERYKNKSELAKFVSFDESDFHIDINSDLITYLIKIINGTIFMNKKILLTNEVKIIFGNILGIFTFEFTNFLIVHKNKSLIFNLKIKNLLESKSFQELQQNANSLRYFLNCIYDSTELEEAIKNKEFIKLESIKNNLKIEFETFFEEDANIINSIESFVCSSETLYYEGSFLMNAKKLFNELFTGYSSKLNHVQKYKILISMFKNNKEFDNFEVIKSELIDIFLDYYNIVFKDESTEITLTDMFWNDMTDTIMCFIIQFVKEISIESLFDFKNSKLRIKNSNILDIMRGLCPRDRMYTNSQINFLRYISNTRTNLNSILNKKYGYIVENK